MKEYLIGTGGWTYFHIPGLKFMAAYARAFNFVEVNATFYQIPSLKKVEANIREYHIVIDTRPRLFHMIALIGRRS